MTTTTTATQFSTRTPPWMKLGTVIDRDDVTSAEAAELGGLNFTVSLQEIGWRDRDDSTGDARWRGIPDRYAVVHDGTGVGLDVVSRSYRLVQYAEGFAFLDSIPGVRHVAAGTLHGGRQGFMVVQVPDTAHLDVSAAGSADPHDLYAIVRSSHDRSRALQVFLMPLRGKCMNQMPLASFGDGALQSWSIRHVGDPKAKLVQASSIIENSKLYAASYAEMVGKLASVEVDDGEAERVLRAVLKDLPKRDDQVTAITTAWRSSPNVDLGQTAWGLVNGVSEYMEWQRPTGTRTNESLFTAALEGLTGKYVRQTAQLLLRRAA